MSKETSTSRVTSIWDFLIILAVLATIVFLTYLLTNRYQTPTDAATVAGVIFPSITAIAAAAFGISQAVRAGVAQNEAAKASAEKLEAEKDLNKKNQVLREKILPEFTALRSDIEPPFRIMETMGSSPSGTRKILLTSLHEQHESPISVETQDLVSARERIAKIETLLDEIIK